MRNRRNLAGAGIAGMLAAGAVAVGLTGARADNPTPSAQTATPIKHVVVLFQENNSFDHYFATYPYAANPTGEPQFTPLADTPTVNGLTSTLLHNNPNAANPQRLDPISDLPAIVSCDNNHGYSAEQKAFDGGLMDGFVANTTGSAPCSGTEVLNYWDGNTVTGLWNYAQHYAMSDNSYGTTFGQSTAGALNVVSGTAAGVVDQNGNPIANGQQNNVDNGTAFANGNPPTKYDVCSPAATNAYMASTAPDSVSAVHKNVGDLLNLKGVTWGYFQGGYAPANDPYPTLSGTAPGPCGSAHIQPYVNTKEFDYDSHHDPFAYYASTANVNHLPPTAPVGQDDQAKHQYDISLFNQAVAQGNLPAVSIVRSPKFEDGHPGNSDPLTEQKYLVDEINAIEKSPDWDSTAIFIVYDDSDGWYDHQMPPIVRSSSTPEDFLNGAGQCGTKNTGTQISVAPDRCGFGPRLPFLVISPYAKENFVDHTLTDQTSVLRFIEDNWNLGRIGNGSVDYQSGTVLNMFDFAHPHATPLILDDTNGEVVKGGKQNEVSTTAQQGNARPPAQGAGKPAQQAESSAPAQHAASTATSGLGRIRYSAHLKGAHKLVIVARFSRSVKTRTSLRFRVLSGGHILATRAVKPKSAAKSVSVTLTTKKALRRHRRYTVKISIDQAGKVTGKTAKLRLA